MAGITAQQLSMILTGSANGARRHIAMIERGERADLRVTTVSALCVAFGVTADWLIHGTGPEPKPVAVRAAVARARGYTLKPTGT